MASRCAAIPARLRPVLSLAALGLTSMAWGCDSDDKSRDPTDSGLGSADAGTDLLPDGRDLGFTAVRQGDEVVLTAPAGALYSAECDPPKLFIRRDGSWFFLEDDRPPSSRHAGYYIDDMFIRPLCNLGCDGASSGPLTTFVLPVVEYIDVGFRVAPPDYELPAGCRSRPEDDADTDAGPPDLPALERQTPTGELAVRVNYSLRGSRTSSTVIVVVDAR